jgi:hypothetical protein
LIQAWSVKGDTDFLVLIKARDSADVERLREQLLRHPDVKNVPTALVLHEWVKRIGRDKLGGPLDDRKVTPGRTSCGLALYVLERSLPGLKP